MITYHTCKLVFRTESTGKHTEKDVKYILTNMLRCRLVKWRHITKIGMSTVDVTATKPRRCFTIPKPGPITAV